MSAVMMECGHSHNTVKSDGAPYCVICGCSVVAPTKPDLTQRKARCQYYGAYVRHGKCASEADSKESLAFFKHDPDSEYDSYYCGCYGWD